jgi:hypothetical protein
LIPCIVVETKVLEEMRRETDAILATSAKLLKELEELRRQLRAAQEALLEQRRKIRRGG